MPADVRGVLEDTAARFQAGRLPWLQALGAVVAPRAAAAALAVAVFLSVALWSRRTESPAFVEVPVEFLTAAHEQYALTLPLAPSERIFADMPDQLAGSVSEARDVF